jgi:hypothetical protein
MRTAISISKLQGGLPFVGTRLAAHDLRSRLEQLLAANVEVEIDFTGVRVSQSFADELIGLALLRHGPDVLQKVIFKGCSDSVRAVIEFVITDRYDEYIRTRAH